MDIKSKLFVRALKHDFIANGYKNLSYLGKGSFGTCYRTYDHKKKNSCAIKIVDRKSIKEELNIYYIIKSKPCLNLIKLFGYYNYYDKIHIVLELCRKETLKTVLTKTKLNEDQCRFISYQLLKGIEYLHDNRIIHRDIKEKNIFFDNYYNIKIGDLGLGVILEEEEEYITGYCGTLSSMAPEVIERLPYSYKVDIWAFGCIFYLLFVGKKAFQAKESSLLILQICYIMYSYPENLNKLVLNIIQKIFVKDPKERASAKELLNFKFFTSKSELKSFPNIDEIEYIFKTDETKEKVDIDYSKHEASGSKSQSMDKDDFTLETSDFEESSSEEISSSEPSSEFPTGTEPSVSSYENNYNKRDN